MGQFQRLARVVLLSGALAGSVLFVLQQFAVIPLIDAAEAYESAAHEGDGAWQPAGWQRMSLTALATVLSGIAFAAILFSTMALTGNRVDARLGALWGLAAFVCFNLAPALRVPLQLPGGAVSDVSERQIWWLVTVSATATGLWLLVGRRTWMFRIAGVFILSLPHLIGAPIATGRQAVPAGLIRQFAVASLVTTGMFWLLLGTIGGFVHSRDKAD